MSVHALRLHTCLRVRARVCWSACAQVLTCTGAAPGALHRCMQCVQCVCAHWHALARVRSCMRSYVVAEADEGAGAGAGGVAAGSRDDGAWSRLVPAAAAACTGAPASPGPKQSLCSECWDTPPRAEVSWGRFPSATPPGSLWALSSGLGGPECQL
jgi:hypothetical protein